MIEANKKHKSLIKNLYIIGNGFDLYHGLDTKYQTFAKYLKKKDSEIYDLLLNYYGLSDVSEGQINDKNDAEWANFESALADLDYAQILDDNSDLAANSFDPNFRDSDWHTYQIEMQTIVEKLTDELIFHFNAFILDIIYPENICNKKIKLKLDSLFINFNYTITLEKYYNIDNSKICYIHNKSVNSESKIYLGHGIDPSNFEGKDEEPPEGLDYDELDEWRNDMAKKYEYSRASAKHEILSYYRKSFKNTKEIIENHKNFFKKIDKIENVFVLGHSISLVDLEYFKFIIKNIKKKAKWYVSYNNEEERKKHMNTLLELGIMRENIKQIRIEDLK